MSSNRFCKGQFFSLDFIVSLAIFVLVLTSIALVWEDVRAQISDIETHKNIYSSAASASDLLVRSPGYPANWSDGDVQSIGFADEPRLLNGSKVVVLLGIDYSKAKTKLGLWNYDFYLNFTDYEGNLITTGLAKPPIAYFLDQGGVLWQKLNGSGLTWDLYYSSASGGADESDFRYSFRGASPIGALNQLLENESEYKTIIIEAHSVKSDQMDRQNVINFLDEGGSIIQFGTSGGNFLLENFSMHYEFAGGSEKIGTIVNPDGLFDLNVGDSVEFQTPVWGIYSDENDSILTPFMTNDANSSIAFAGRWPYSAGLIYFVGDVDAEVNNQTDLFDSIDLVGDSFEYGVKPPSSASDVIVVNRVAVMTTTVRQLANMHLIVWK